MFKLRNNKEPKMMHGQSHTFPWQACVMLNLLLMSFHFSKDMSVTWWHNSSKWLFMKLSFV